MDSDEAKTWHIELSRSERAILMTLGGWIFLGKVLGVIFIIVGSFALSLASDNRFLGAVAGFLVCSAAIAILQLLLLGLPYGLSLGAPCGAIVGALLIFFRPTILYKYLWFVAPRWWPNQLLLGAALGALGGTVLVSGFVGYWLIDIEGVHWWPLAVYKRALERLRVSVIRVVSSSRSNQRQKGISPEISFNSDEGDETYETLGPTQDPKGVPDPAPAPDC